MADSFYTIGKPGRYTDNLLVLVDGQRVGELVPQRAPGRPSRVTEWLTEVWLEHEAMADDGGFPNSYRTLRDAKKALNTFMERNGITKDEGRPA